MYWNNKNVSAIKTENIKNLSEGSVTIQDKKVMLNYDAYSKREKIYDENGIWIDTKPLLYNNIVKSLIVK